MGKCLSSSNWMNIINDLNFIKRYNLEDNLKIKDTNTRESKEWSHVELVRLDWLAEIYNGMMWHNISKKLGSNRHPVTCLQKWKKLSILMLASFRKNSQDPEKILKFTKDFELRNFYEKNKSFLKELTKQSFIRWSKYEVPNVKRQTTINFETCDRSIFNEVSNFIPFQIYTH